MSEQEYYLKLTLDKLLPDYLAPLYNDIVSLKSKNAELEIKLNDLMLKGYTPYQKVEQNDNTYYTIQKGE